MSGDVETAAGKLTARQRAAVVAGHGSLAVCRALKAKGIACRVEGTGMAWSAFPIFTGFGMSLRSYLQSKELP